MKDAVGEANLTVVAIILIAVIVAIMTPIVKSMMSTTGKRTCCTDAGYIWEENQCKSVDDTGTKSNVNESTYWDSTGKKCNITAGNGGGSNGKKQ